MFLPVLIPVLVLALIYGGSFFHGENQAQANVATFHPAHCLGGWKNVDNIAGQPDVRLNNDVQYDDTNSASLFNSNAQVFYGGFSGDIPYAAKHERVTLNFSWYIADGPQPERREESKTPEVIPAEVSAPSLEEGTSSVSEDGIVPEQAVSDTEAPVNTDNASTIEAPAEESEEVVPEEPAEPTAVRFLKSFFTVVHAQEISPEEEPVLETPEEEAIVAEELETPVLTEEVIPESVTIPSSTPAIVEESVSDTSVPPVRDKEEQQAIEEAHEQAVIEAGVPENAYFEVLYTLDGQEWHTLGYVNRIANDVQIELPIDLFATVEDLKKVQIALHTVERFDTVPKIYLDSLWLEVAYDDVTATEFAPPGQRPGDVIFSETVYEDTTAVVVLRNVALMTLSNVLTAASPTAASSSTEQASTTDTELDTNASSTDQTQVLTDVVSTSTLADIINSTGVLVELWLYSSTTDDWSRIADDSIISRNPQVKFVDGNIFWVDKNNESVWRYDPKSGGYDALSFSEGQSSKMQFRNESGELRELDFSYGTSSVQINAVSSPLIE